MGLSRNKQNRNFPGGAKAQGGRLITLNLDLGLRHFKGKAVELLLEISWRSHGTKSKQTQQKFPRWNKGTRRQTGNPKPRLRATPFQREGGRDIIGDFPVDPMRLSRNKHNRNLPGRTKAQGGRLVP